MPRTRQEIFNPKNNYANKKPELDPKKLKKQLSSIEQNLSQLLELNATKPMKLPNKDDEPSQSIPAVKSPQEVKIDGIPVKSIYDEIFK